MRYWSPKKRGAYHANGVNYLPACKGGLAKDAVRHL